MRKVLRDAYKILKELPNINRVPLNSPEDTVTVVGELKWRLFGNTTKIDSKGVVILHVGMICSLHTGSFLWEFQCPASPLFTVFTHRPK